MAIVHLGAGLAAGALGMQYEFVRLVSTWSLGQRNERDPIAFNWFVANPGVGWRIRTDEIVEWHAVRVRQWDQKFQRGLALAGLQTGQRAHRNPGRGREIGKGQAGAFPKALQARAYRRKHIAHILAHDSTLPNRQGALQVAEPIGQAQVMSKHQPPTVMDQAFWDKRYRSASSTWDATPHAHLLTGAAELTPGQALDVGTGIGGDAIWLAEHDWKVVAVDISPVALERGANHAKTLGDEVASRIEWQPVDLTEWEPPQAQFDLVTSQFVHLPSAVQIPMHARLAASVAPGGILLVVGHHPSDLDTESRRFPDPDPLFTAEQLAARLDSEWTILATDTRPRSEVGRTGQAITVHDAVLVAQRAPSL